MTMPPPGPMPRQGGMGGGRPPQPFLDAGPMPAGPPMAGPPMGGPPMEGPQFPPRFMAIMQKLPPELAQEIIMSLQPDTQGQGAMPPGGMVG